MYYPYQTLLVFKKNRLLKKRRIWSKDKAIAHTSKINNNVLSIKPIVVFTTIPLIKSNYHNKDAKQVHFHATNKLINKKKQSIYNRASNLILLKTITTL